MSNVIAISATLIMCMQGQVADNGKCPDGSPPFTAQVNILNGTANCPDPYAKGVKCVAKLDSIVEIYQGKQRLFVLHPSGDAFVGPGYKPNETAIMFWRALAESMPKELEFVK